MTSRQTNSILTPATRRRRLARVRCLLFDVDGVLTDGKLHFTSDGQEFKTFDVQDGHGLAMARRMGLILGIISGRPSAATTKRAAELGLSIVKQGARDKTEMLDEIQREHGFRDDEIVFVGDELVDLPVMRRVAFAVAVSNAVPEVRQVAHYVTRKTGGDGAVREVVELILKARGQWRKAIAKYLGLLVAGLLGLTSLTATAKQPTAYIEKFEVPERDAEGNLKWKLNGDRAMIDGDGVMTIINARAEMYESNKVTTVFSAARCRLDRAENRLETEEPIRVERHNMTLTGIGGTWSGKDQTVMIRSNVQVVIENAREETLP